jgi:hypothetical protein
MAKHVRMRLQFEAKTSVRRALDHPSKAGGREGRAALADEDARSAVFDPAHGSTAPLKSTWSQRRSLTSAARSPWRKATRIIVASQ